MHRVSFSLRPCWHLLTFCCLLYTWDFVSLDVVLFCFSVLGIEPRASQIPGKYIATTAVYSRSFFTFIAEVHDCPRWPLSLQSSLAFRLHSLALNFRSSCLSFLISGLIGPSLASFVYSVLKSWFFNMSLWFWFVFSCGLGSLMTFKISMFVCVSSLEKRNICFICLSSLPAPFEGGLICWRLTGFLLSAVQGSGGSVSWLPLSSQITVFPPFAPPLDRARFWHWEQLPWFYFCLFVLACDLGVI